MQQVQNMEKFEIRLFLFIDPQTIKKYKSILYIYLTYIVIHYLETRWFPFRVIRFSTTHIIYRLILNCIYIISIFSFPEFLQFPSDIFLLLYI